MSGTPASDPKHRLSRAAVFAVGIGIAASACWTNKSDPQHAQQQTTVVPDAAVTPDAAVVQNPQPNPDEGHYQNHPCVDTPQGPMCAPYGAPPKRRRIV